MKLAQEGSLAQRSIDYDLYPVSHLKRTIRQNNLEIWNNRWLSSTCCPITHKHLPTVFYRLRIKKVFHPNYCLTQFLTNHGKLNAYLERFKTRSDQTCSHCIGETEDAEHVVFSCALYEDRLQQLIDKVIVQGFQWHCELKELIDFNIFSSFNKFCISIFKNRNM